MKGMRDDFRAMIFGTKMKLNKEIDQLTAVKPVTVHDHYDPKSDNMIDHICDDLIFNEEEICI